MMKRYIEAINLALDYNLVDLAKIYANKCPDKKLSEQLWLEVKFFFFFNQRKLKIAVYLINSGEAIEYIK